MFIFSEVFSQQAETTREKKQRGNKEDIKPVTLLLGLEGLGLGMLGKLRNRRN
jgi:hypothetical protein